MIERCSIDRQVMIVGHLKCMQLWDVGVWREQNERGQARLSAASTAVARKGDAPAPVQYVIHAGGRPPGGEPPAGR
jgi:hypothetical protein